MANSLNRATILGNVGQDPEIRSIPSGGSVANFSVATSETWKDKSTGEKKERTEWHRISVFAEHTVNFVQQYVNKGSRVYVEGQIQTRKWQAQDGSDRYSTEIVVKPFVGQVILLDRHGDGETARPAAPAQEQTTSGYSDLDDNVPF